LVKAPLLAVDAPSVLFRAYYALSDSIKGAGGRPVNALLGSVNIVLREVLEHDPRAVVMCFGDDAAEYRVEAFPDYHADRTDPLPDTFEPQYRESPDLYEQLGWFTADQRGLEADDLLNSFALSEQRAGGRVLILTGDRDMFQCVGEDCTVLYLKTGGPMGAEVVDEAEVERRYGVPPALVPDFIALRGDTSDGIPGAAGIGPKTAADLLVRHGSLEAAIAAREAERPRVAGSLADERLPMFKDLATLRKVRVRRPRDRRTNFKRGAAAAGAAGMNRLAERLEGLAPGA
jgi:5'-3' exonuclease